METKSEENIFNNDISISIGILIHWFFQNMLFIILSIQKMLIKGLIYSDTILDSDDGVMNKMEKIPVSKDLVIY